MKSLSKKMFVLSFLLGVCSLTLGTAIGISWNKSQIIPVVLVKPDIGGFVPREGSPIGNTWQKSQVTPVVLVKPSIGGFEPTDGATIGNTWSKQQTSPVMLVEPSVGGFVPSHFVSSDEVVTRASKSPGTMTDGDDGTSTMPPTIESQVNGDFEGWDGDTIVELTNGQIWKQSEYHYHYHYAYMPHVLLFRASGGYKMKVDGSDEAVGVDRLK